jgi:hypothetical protein
MVAKKMAFVCLGIHLEGARKLIKMPVSTAAALAKI